MAVLIQTTQIDGQAVRVFDHEYRPQRTAAWRDGEELLRSLTAYRTFFIRNGMHIAGSGYPEESFSQDPMLDAYFSLCVPSKPPANIYGNYIAYQHFDILEPLIEQIHRHAPQQVRYQYAWTRTSPLPGFKHMRSSYRRLAKRDADRYARQALPPQELCSYREAGFADCFTTEEGQRIEQLRPKLFRIKRKAIDLFIRALAGTPSFGKTLDKALVKAIASEMSLDELLFLVYAEQKIAASGFSRYLMFLYRFAYPLFVPEAQLTLNTAGSCGTLPFNAGLCGSLSLLFPLAGFIQREVTTNYRQLCIRGLEIEGRHPNCGLPTGNRPKSNQIKEEIIQLNKEFWTGYTGRIEQLLNTELTTEVSYSFPLKKEHLDTYLPILKQLIRLQSAAINQTGHMIQLQPPAASAPAAATNQPEELPANLFRKAGEGFEIRFKGRRPILLKESIGLHYIRTLLQNPNTPISAKDLRSMQNAAPANTTPAADYDDGLNRDSGTREAPDRRALQLIASKLTQLESEKAEANARGDYDRAEDILKKIEQIRSYLNGYKYVQKDPEAERHRTGVYNAIKTVHKKLELHYPELARHLQERIETGHTCIYLNLPQDHIEWHFEYEC